MPHGAWLQNIPGEAMLYGRRGLQPDALADVTPASRALYHFFRAGTRPKRHVRCCRSGSHAVLTRLPVRASATCRMLDAVLGALRNR